MRVWVDRLPDARWLFIAEKAPYQPAFANQLVVPHRSQRKTLRREPSRPPPRSSVPCPCPLFPVSPANGRTSFPVYGLARRYQRLPTTKRVPILTKMSVSPFRFSIGSFSTNPPTASKRFLLCPPPTLFPNQSRCCKGHTVVSPTNKRIHHFPIPRQRIHPDPSVLGTTGLHCLAAPSPQTPPRTTFALEGTACPWLDRARGDPAIAGPTPLRSSSRARNSPQIQRTAAFFLTHEISLNFHGSTEPKGNPASVPMTAPPPSSFRKGRTSGSATSRPHGMANSFPAACRAGGPPHS